MAGTINPSSVVVGTVTLSITDLTSGQQVSPTLNRLNNPILFKAVQVIYEGYVNLVPNSSTGTISPAPGTPIFSLLYVRNGGSTTAILSYTLSNTTAQTFYIDPGAIFFWQTPLQTSTAGVLSGLNNFAIGSPILLPVSNVEVLAAA
jgi:hypothetical protein